MVFVVSNFIVKIYGLHMSYKCQYMHSNEMTAMFSFDARATHGYHIYKDVWLSPCEILDLITSCVYCLGHHSPKGIATTLLLLGSDTLANGCRYDS